jgi:GMP synthase (glutamine-hydrolysing)
VKKLWIFKLGTTWADTLQRLGDFDRWTMSRLDVSDGDVGVVDIELGEPPPEHEQCAGIVMTGSHAMVTDELPWSVGLEAWLREGIDRRIPMLGVCYGHQLLASAAGGMVGYHPNGREIGTVEIQTLPLDAPDSLFGDAPESFLAHTTHAQTVLELPPGAVRLAANDYEANHAFRLGECAWGVQFHPEYDTRIMREYINGQAEKLKAAGRDVDALLRAVTDTPVAGRILSRFGAFVLDRLERE